MKLTDLLSLLSKISGAIENYDPQKPVKIAFPVRHGGEKYEIVVTVKKAL